MQLSMNIC